MADDADDPRASWMRDMLALIEQQIAQIATMAPGTTAHRQATETLLLLQDSLHDMSEAKQVYDRLRSFNEAHSNNPPTKPRNSA